VATLVSNAMELAEIELRRHHVRLTHYIAARLPALMVDPILIEQVLINLMKNAAESIAHARLPTARRSVELRVVPKTIDDCSVVEFSVTDNGLGISPEVMDRLYEAFYSTKAEGMGIGLKLCRSIVESHQGRLKAENIYNAEDVTGCRFTFWIPVKPERIESASDRLITLPTSSITAGHPSSNLISPAPEDRSILDNNAHG
jgi:signal transduction histidine kinase